MRVILPILFLGCLFAQTQDSLPWKGVIVFGPWVRVDDADSVVIGHPAIHPQTVFDEKNMVLYSVWEDDRDNTGSNEIFFAKSVDTAKIWTRPNMNLSMSAGIDDVYPWLCVDSVNLYVVWQSWRNNTWKVYLTKSTDEGLTWSTPDTVPGIMIDNSFSSGINFGPQPKIAADSRSDPDSTFLYIVWADEQTGLIQIRLATSVDFGVSFTDLGIVDKNPTNVNRHPYIVVDDSGVVHCAWARGTGGSNNDPHPWIGYNRSTDRGLNFMANDLIVNDDSSGVYRGNPSITYNAINGNVLICWEDSRRASGNANPDVWFGRMHRDSLLFEPNRRVNWWGTDTNATYDNFRPVIRMSSMDTMGIMVAAWHDNPATAGSYGIHMAAYMDTIGRFSNSQSLINTFTGTSGANFGNDFYSPSLFVTTIDSVTNFFIVWQDFSEDSTGGNIYSVRGWVVEVLADIDVDNDSLDVVNDTMDLHTQPAGPVYSPYAKGTFILANTSETYNPDSIDGPSLSRVDSLTYTSTWDSTFMIGLPLTMGVGETAVCTLAIVIPEGTTAGQFSGAVTITGVDSVGGPTSEIFYFKFQGPEPRGSLDSFRVAPIPFKPHRNPDHDAIHFQGLSVGARVKVFDLSGSLVWSATEDGDGHVAWDAEVGSGIYIYLVVDTNGNVRKGKLSVIR